jgi:uncharacterized membrane protein
MGSVVGVILESLWCLIKNHRIESRKGLIFGPFNPLYGFAAMILSLIINTISNHSTGNIFLIGVVVASIIEYLCSYFQEKIVGTVSWNYKDFKFNLKGRINLLYSIAWGFLTVFWYNSIMPILDGILPFFNNYEVLTIISLILMVIDCAVSLFANIRRYKRKQKIYAKSKIEKHFDYLYDDELLEKIYPNSEFVEK